VNLLQIRQAPGIFPAQEGAMSELLYRCPQTGRELALGIALDPDVFARARLDYRTIFCPHCGQKHEWTKEEVYFRIPPERDKAYLEKKGRRG